MINDLLDSINRRFIGGEATFDSARYWIDRYRSGGTSGRGSYDQLARFKADVLNSFVEHYRVRSVIEFGCGDGNQLKLAQYPRYVGYDVSEEAVCICRDTFADESRKSFRLVREYNGETAELALSLDVIYHLVEDEVYEEYMRRLFDSAERFVIIYSSNTEDRRSFSPHVRHRRFSQWIDLRRPEWSLLRRIPNRYPPSMAGLRGSFADFYVYERQSGAGELPDESDAISPARGARRVGVEAAGDGVTRGNGSG